MQKLALTFLTFLLSFSFLFGQNFFNKTNFEEEKTIVVLTNPTISNIKNITFLIGNNFISDTSIIYVGVYYKYQKYNFENSRKYISENNLVNFYMHEIKDTLTLSNIFTKNDCSDDFLKIFAHSNGAVFFGGPDLPPAMYKEKTSTLTYISDPYRHYFEASFLFHLLGGSQNNDFVPYMEKNKNYSIRGFCLGMQTMNVATGGTMYQDIPSEIYNIHYDEDILKLDKNQQHKNYNYTLTANNKLIYGNFHQIAIKDKSLAGKKFLKINPYTISSHHQAIKKLGKNLQTTATSIDGKIIEAVKHTKYPNVIGVQFHPENRYIFHENIKYKFSQQDKNYFTGLDVLKKNNSLEFHKVFWAKFINGLK